MPIGAKKSKKSKSKRLSLKQKYKVLKKVREHHRKKRKEGKKLGRKKKEPKDPGIPNAWPFKEELVAQLKAQRERELAKQRAMQERSFAAKKQAMEEDGAEGGMQALQGDAAARAREFRRAARAARAEVVAAPSGFVDSSRRAFYKEFVKVAEASDVLIEVLDARDPLGGRCLDVERFVRRLDSSKKIVLLLNKIDLVPREVVEAWLKYFREELPAVAFKCSTQRQATNLGRRSAGATSAAADAALRGSECLGADTLLQLLKNYARSANLKTAITVGVVGLPNVGKSSVINSLKRTRVAQVGNTPGVTKSVQEVHLDRQVTLLDSPGVVFAADGPGGAAAAALRNAVKVEQLEDPALPVAEIVARCPGRQLMELYKVPAFKGADEFLQHVAQARGKLKKGGGVDMAAAARIVLQDWNDGRIPYYTLPPTRATEVEGSAQLVADWGAAFNTDAVFQQEASAVIQGLPSLDDPSGSFFQTQSAGAAQVDFEALQQQAGQQGSGSDGEDSEQEEAGSEDTVDSDEEGEEGPSGSEAEEMDEGEAAAPAPWVTRGAASAKQNVQLYAQSGQFNPHAARAERKRRKRSGTAASLGGGGDSDYEFEEGHWEGQAAAGSGNQFEQIAAEDQ